MPQVDELYFERPSIRLGSFLRLMMQEAGAPFINLMPGENKNFVSIPVHEMESLDEVLRKLQQDDAVLPRGSYYYRGQTARRQVQYLGRMTARGNVLPIGPRVTFKIESFLPSAFRRYLEEMPGASTPVVRWPEWKPESAIAAVTPVARAIMQSHDDELRSFLRRYFLDLSEHPEITTARALGVMGAASNRTPQHLVAPGTNVLKSLLNLISWAQHYEFGSIMADISASPAVAAWFASHRWSGEVANSLTGQGVIYRFDYAEIRAFLEKELDRETPMAPLIRALGFLGLTDISHLPQALGKRPAAQQGGSFFGLENAVFGYLMSMYPGLELFTFPLRSVSGRESGYSKEDLCPPDDPALKIFPDPQARHAPLTSNEIRGFLQAESFDGRDIELLARSFEMGLI